MNLSKPAETLHKAAPAKKMVVALITMKKQAWRSVLNLLAKIAKDDNKTQRPLSTNP